MFTLYVRFFCCHNISFGIFCLLLAFPCTFKTTNGNFWRKRKTSRSSRLFAFVIIALAQHCTHTQCVKETFRAESCCAVAAATAFPWNGYFRSEDRSDFTRQKSVMSYLSSGVNCAEKFILLIHCAYHWSHGSCYKWLCI